MIVEPSTLEDFLDAAGRFAELVWERIDSAQLVSRAAIAAAIPEAQHKGWGGGTSNSMSYGSGMPPTAVAPDPAEVFPRRQLAAGRMAGRVTVALKRIFADAGAVQQ